MFKKVVSAIMVAAMVGTMVAPVSVSAKDGGKTIELWTCWTEGADTEKASQEMIQKWEEETGNTVNQTNFTYDMLHEKNPDSCSRWKCTRSDLGTSGICW